MAADNTAIVAIPLCRESGYMFYITFLLLVFKVIPIPVAVRSEV